MDGIGLAVCDHIFTYKCSGEVANLIRAAERYGTLLEKARLRVEAVCRECRRYAWSKDSNNIGGAPES